MLLAKAYFSWVLYDSPGDLEPEYVARSRFLLPSPWNLRSGCTRESSGADIYL